MTNRAHHAAENHKPPVTALARTEDWQERWAERDEREVTFDPRQRRFADLHNLFARTLPSGRHLRFLEIGCFPGSYLWYFHRHFGYRVAGIEYVDACSERAGQFLRRAGVEADIINADFFSYELPPGSPPFDVVASFGFVEHYTDVAPVLARQAALVAPGGYLVTVVPNHAGLNGKILRLVNPRRFGEHNCMTLDDLRLAMSRLADARIIELGYFGRLGFWNSGLYDWLRRKGSLAYLAGRSPLWLLESAGRLLPETAALSPFIACVAQRFAP